ncbi:multicopper oxidase family protein [Bosea robiniae]|uniref:Multicopper oxidase with three cupredoxin domains (Includes cell division protein FtsP and spore coat protein CotA) n=1 Tax=Bosea robiniae TaxID=1036780 RepID=A0ABY0NVU2_9HYPH|nr:copper oxidase [Bosea robiniae]SDG23507.1 Multicopper oxidase with three cupredoxin domains (includes cell division protein FtsP and spore coat protein CotA) [Bosea robiniae]
MTSLSRRGFIGSSGLVLAGAAAVSGRAAFAAVPEAPTMAEATTQAPLVPTTGPDYQPVATLNGWSLPWKMNGDWKEFHLVAEPVVRELAPGMKAYLWGYNGQSPGPTIEAVEGDKVRIYVTNKLPESTAVHWHGQRLPNGMDGVGGLTQPHIPSGKTFVYEFLLRRSGTFMYHPHSDEMVQMAMGMMGFFVVHPKDPAFRRVDRDFVFLLNAFDIEPGSYVPRVAEMTEFNMWCWNSRVFPGIDPFVVGLNDKVRIRFGNLTMTNHPVHMHGYEFKVSCTDGGWVDPAAAWDEVSIDVAVGQMRAFDFVADEPGDWAIHCHKSHHTMNAMGHSVKNYIGVSKKDLAKRIARIAPGYMPMGSNGMGEMGAMEMPLPDNTLPMMTGFAQFGPVEMGGMFSVVKVREGLAKTDYKDPGWFKHPEGTVAYELKGAKLGEAPRATPPDSGIKAAEWRAKDPRKPSLGPDGKPRPTTKNPHSNH